MTAIEPDVDQLQHLDLETWMAIPGFEGYEVSDCGCVRSYRTRGHRNRRRIQPIPLRTQVDRHGRPRVVLYVDGKSLTRPIHQLVMAAFVGPCPAGQEVCHNNGRALDNQLQNLRYDTPKSNQADRVLHGTDVRGEKHPLCKLTTADVRAMRDLRDHGWTYAAIAKDFGMSASRTAYICRGLAWPHVEQAAG